MTVEQLKDTLQLKILAGANGMDREISGCYIGDLLSWVMSRAQEGDVWLTVMGNINAIAVAALADTACIVLTENAALDAEAAERANRNNMAVLQTEENSYRTALKLAALLA